MFRFLVNNLPAIYSFVHVVLFSSFIGLDSMGEANCNTFDYLLSHFTNCSAGNIRNSLLIWLILLILFLSINTYFFVLRNISKNKFFKIIRNIHSYPNYHINQTFSVLGVLLWMIALIYVVVTGGNFPINGLAGLVYFACGIFFPTFFICLSHKHYFKFITFVLAIMASLIFLTKIPVMLLVLSKLRSMLQMRRLLKTLSLIVLVLLGIAYFSAYRSFVTNEAQAGVLYNLTTINVDLLYVLGRFLARILLIDATIFTNQLIEIGYVVMGAPPLQTIDNVNNYFDYVSGRKVSFGFAVGLPMLMYVWLGYLGLPMLVFALLLLDQCVKAIFRNLCSVDGLATIRIFYFFILMQDGFGLTTQLLLFQILLFALGGRLIAYKKKLIATS